MKRAFVVWAFAALAGWAFVPVLWAQDYPPGVLYVTFQPGAIDSLYEDSTGFTLCGIPYIDSVNWANNCAFFSLHGGFRPA